MILSLRFRRLHLKAKNGTGSWEDIWSATGRTFPQGGGHVFVVSRNDKMDEHGAYRAYWYPQNGKFSRDTSILSTLGKRPVNHPVGGTLFSQPNVRAPTSTRRISLGLHCMD